MSTYDSKLGDTLERKQRQQVLNAEHILEVVMKRHRWTPALRDELAAALAKVADGKPLRVSNNSKKGWATTMKREAGK